MNDNERTVMFRTALGGFNKEDVNLYIYNENKRFAAVEQSYIDNIEELKLELDARTNEMRSMSERLVVLEDVNEKLAAAEDEIERLSAKLSGSENTALDLAIKLEEKSMAVKTLEDSIEAASASIRAEYETTIADIKSFFEAETNTIRMELISAKLAGENADIEKNSALAALEALKEELEAEKAKNATLAEENADICEKQAIDIYETERIAEELIARATEASEEILARSEEGASVIIERAKEEAFSFRNDIFTAAREMISAAAEELQKSVGICLSDFMNGIRSTKFTSGRTSVGAGRFEDELGRRISRMQNDLDRAIAEKLAEFDRKHGGAR